MAKAVYFNIDDNLDYENSLLKEWGVTNLELVEIKDKSDKQPFTDYLQDADGLVVEYEQITADVLDKLPNLKIVALQSIGYNNVDADAATAHGVCLTNVPGFCAEEVAIHTIGLSIDLTRKITFFDKSVRSGTWDPLIGYKTYRMSGKTFGMVFFGAIPKIMAPILKAMGMRVLVYAPTKTSEYLAGFGCEKAESLDELLEQSDYVSMHCPLIQGVTHHLMGEAQFKKMKPSAYFINTARGSVVDEPALVKALKNGWIKGAGIDVIEDEANEKSELFELNDNVVITPHAAWISEDSFYSARKIALEQLVALLSRNERPQNLVNKAVKL
jgi:D-3-phosphoglycerate dehydrogenase